jgi:hypothetical protein
MTYATNMSSNGAEAMRNLAKATIDYCTAAQLYFEYNAGGLSISDTVTAVTAENLSEYSPVTSGSMPEGITSRKLYASFDSDNSLRISYKLSAGKSYTDYTFKIDDAIIVPTLIGEEYCLTVPNVSAKNLGDVHTFTVSDATNTASVSVSVLSYARTSVLNGTTERKNLGKALYLYNLAAKAYFASIE